VLKGINRLTSGLIIETRIDTFVSKRVLSKNENWGNFKDKKNSDYGEFDR
jgi:hypothetical protein